MEVVQVARRGRVLEVTLDRPKVNAIDAATSIALGEAFRQLQEDEDLSVGIVTGAGERFFCAGWDLKAASAGEPADADQGVGGFAGLTEYWDLNKPVVAAVNGMALSWWLLSMPNSGSPKPRSGSSPTPVASSACHGGSRARWPWR
jgi:crotonobetainyl-CoA hydratase